MDTTDENHTVSTRRLRQPFIVDTNRANTRRQLFAMNKLQQWKSDGVIRLNYTFEIQRELERCRNPKFREASHALGVLFARSCSAIEEKEQRDKIAGIIFPNGLKDNTDRVDVDTIRVAQLWGAIVITDDGASKRQPGGLLGATLRLHREVGVKVIRDVDAEGMVSRLINQRDQLEIFEAAFEKRTVADWCGKD